MQRLNKKKRPTDFCKVEDRVQPQKILGRNTKGIGYFAQNAMGTVKHAAAKLLPESKQCPTEGWKDSLQRESSLQGISSKGKMAPASALLKPSSSFCPLQANICSSNERGPVQELGLPFPADLIRHPQTDSVLMALEKLGHVALVQVSLSETGLKCSFPVFLLFTPLD